MRGRVPSLSPAEAPCLRDALGEHCLRHCERLLRAEASQSAASGDRRYPSTAGRVRSTHGIPTEKSRSQSTLV